MSAGGQYIESEKKYLILLAFLILLHVPRTLKGQFKPSQGVLLSTTDMRLDSSSYFHPPILQLQAFHRLSSLMGTRRP